MNLFVIVLFSFTLALHLFILEATHYSIIALLGRPTSWEAEYHLEVDYDTCCQEMCRANESCKSYDQIWQPSRDIYECRFYSKNYQVLKAEGEKLELIPRVQYYSKMHKMTNCSDWFHKGGAREGIPYKMVDGVLEDCDYSFFSCDEVVNKGLLEDRIEAVFPIFISAVNEIKNIRCRKYHDKGWVVFQKRVEPAKFPFNKKSWQEYKEGFEESKNDFWLGNELLHQWTKDKENELLILLEYDEYGWHAESRHRFNVGPENTYYQLYVSNTPSFDVTAEIPGYRSFNSNIHDLDRGRFHTFDNNRTQEGCASKLFNGEGMAGWIQSNDKCNAKWVTYFNARVPKRYRDSFDEVQNFPESVMMFREK
ncbi:fibrinogen alpha chain-like [Clytia hemisphaerica]|uniref:Fibrinogen C-terminal domain-containing protein n=1 Tax=Clytia hemisphaerica TaxID=252671 RepID=A0A7M5X0T0_9CNID